MEKPERDAPATDWSKMLQPLFRCQVPRESKEGGRRLAEDRGLTTAATTARKIIKILKIFRNPIDFHKII
jgi:hypothetical protein